MGKKVRSARGIEVDFDLLKIKQQIAEGPSINVASRENFVEKRLRRRTKRSVVPVPATKVAEPEALAPEQIEQELDDVIMDEITRGREQDVDPEIRPVRKVSK